MAPPERAQSEDEMRLVTRRNARWLALLVSPSHDPKAQATAQEWADDWFDALAAAPALDALTRENATEREWLAYNRGYHKKAIDGSHIPESVER